MQKEPTPISIFVHIMYITQYVNAHKHGLELWTHKQINFSFSLFLFFKFKIFMNLEQYSYIMYLI